MAGRLRGLGAGVLAAAALFAGSAFGATGKAVSLASPFTLASGFQSDLGAGRAVLASNGTAWLAQPLTGSGSFEIVARTGGRDVRVGRVTVPSGSATSRPAVSVAGGTATFVWETETNVAGSGGRASVQARACTLVGCGAVQVLSSWRWTDTNESFPAMGYQAQPAVTSADGRTIVMFLRDTAAAPQMVWAQTVRGARFGPVHAFGPGVQPDPVLVDEAGGRVLAAWLDADSSTGWWIDWSVWSPARSGFEQSRILAAGRGDYAGGLVGAPSGSGAAIAWIQGSNSTDPGLLSEPVWVARQATQTFTRAARVFAGDAFGLSIAGADRMLALTFTTTPRPGLDADSPGPVMVMRAATGQPFSAPIDLDADAQPDPAVSVTSNGQVLVTWNDTHALVAMANANAPFDSPITLGPQSPSDSPPTIDTIAGRSLIVWQSPSGTTRGDLAEP
jgi:hypothetical protein